jgi:hypothetical protein
MFTTTGFTRVKNETNIQISKQTEYYYNGIPLWNKKKQISNKHSISEYLKHDKEAHIKEYVVYYFIKLFHYLHEILQKGNHFIMIECILVTTWSQEYGHEFPRNMEELLALVVVTYTFVKIH